MWDHKGIGVPVKDIQLRTETGKQLVLLSGVGKLNLIQTDLADIVTDDLRTKYSGQQLTAKADAQYRHILAHRGGNQRKQSGQVGMFAVFPGRNRRAEDNQSFRKFCRRLGPWVVRKLSGWNWTPSREKLKSL